MRHSLMTGCACDDCERQRFEMRAVLVVVLGLAASASVALLWVAR